MDRWLASQFTMLSAVVIGIVGLITVGTHMDASLAGFVLSFADSITFDVSSRSLSIVCISLKKLERLCSWFGDL